MNRRTVALIFLSVCLIECFGGSVGRVLHSNAESNYDYREEVGSMDGHDVGGRHIIADDEAMEPSAPEELQRAMDVLDTTSQTYAAHHLRIKPTGTEFLKNPGSSFLLTCEVVGLDSEAAKNLRLRWIGKDGGEILNDAYSGRNIYTETEGQTLKKLYITNIQEGDEGTYTCSSSINGATETKSVALQLFKDITFDFAPSPQHLQMHTDGVITCRASGNPRPGISWRHRGRRIPNGDRYVLEDGGLRIKNLTRNDDGIYICRAEVESDGRYNERSISVIVDGLHDEQQMEIPNLAHVVEESLGGSGLDDKPATKRASRILKSNRMIQFVSYSPLPTETVPKRPEIGSSTPKSSPGKSGWVYRPPRPGMTVCWFSSIARRYPDYYKRRALE